MEGRMERRRVERQEDGRKKVNIEEDNKKKKKQND